jgi:hypothetical protein
MQGKKWEVRSKNVQMGVHSARTPPHMHSSLYRDVSLQRYTLGFLLSNIRYFVILKMLMTCTFRKPILSLVYKAVAYFVDLDLLIRFFI